MQRKLIISLVFAILLVFFALQNSAEVVIRLWFWSASTSLALVVILTFAAGAVMGLLFSIPARRRRKKSDNLPSTDPGSTSTNEVSPEVNSQANRQANLQEEDPRDKNGDPEFEDVMN